MGDQLSGVDGCADCSMTADPFWQEVRVNPADRRLLVRDNAGWPPSKKCGVATCFRGGESRPPHIESSRDFYDDNFTPRKLGALRLARLSGYWHMGAPSSFPNSSLGTRVGLGTRYGFTRADRAIYSTTSTNARAALG